MTPETLADYYRDAHVREQIAEFCGLRAGGPPASVFLTSMRGAEGPFATWDDAPRDRPEDLEKLLNAGADIARSMWDRETLLIHFDFDYLNIDYEGEPYAHPADVFHKLEPTFRAAEHVFDRYGLSLLPVVTGRGYHFTGSVPLGSPLIDRIADLSPHVPAWLVSVDERRPAWSTPDITPRFARAWVGAGMLVEFLAHKIIRRARPRSPIPVIVNNTIVGSGEVGRECVSVDLSYAGDPLDIRHIRVAFGAYQKHRFRPDIFGRFSEHAALAAVPRVHASIEHMLLDRADFRHAARLARATSAALPDTTAGLERLLDAYLTSKLAGFHREFNQAIPSRRTDEDPLAAASKNPLPACVTRPLEAPNDPLLQPAVIQHITRVLMAEGVRPRDIAALIQARYEADYGWGRRWSWTNAESRALFDVRVFSGMIVTGLDRAIDLNCRSAQEKGLCPGGECGLDLRNARALLLDTVRS